MFLTKQNVRSIDPKTQTESYVKALFPIHPFTWCFPHRQRKLISANVFAVMITKNAKYHMSCMQNTEIAAIKKKEAFCLFLFFLGVALKTQGVCFTIEVYQERREFSVDWNKIKAEYIAGGTSYRKLCQKYDANLSVLKRIAREENWVGLREQCKAKTATKIVEIESDKQAERMRRLLKVSDDLLCVVEEAVHSFKVGELVLDRTALKSLSGTIKDIKDIQNIKTELDIEEQKARIANLKRQSERDEDSKDVTVEISKEAVDYCG